MISILLEDDNAPKAPTSLSALDVLRRFAKGLKQRGVPKLGKPIGRGTRGIVFPTTDNRVLKVTSDAKEATSSAKIKGLDLNGIVKVFDVWKFGDFNIYGILQERLEQLPDDAIKRINTIFSATNFTKALGSSYDWDVALETSEKMTLENFKKYPQVAKKLGMTGEQVIDELHKILDEYNIRDYFESLKKIGIKFHDFSGDNFMIRSSDGSIVLIDLGYSKGSGGEPELLSPDVIKEMLRRYIRYTVAKLL